MFPVIFWNKEKKSLDFEFLFPYAPTSEVLAIIFMVELLLFEAMF